MEMSIRFPNIGLELDHVGRAFSILGYEITYYGILVAVGMILGLLFIVLEAKRKNQSTNLYLGMMLTAAVTGVIGARLWYVGFSWSLYRGNIQAILNIRGGGLAFYGGLLGGSIGAALFCKIAKTSFWKMADTASMGLLIAQIIGRWGDFFNRESIGEYTDSYFAMQLPLSSVQTGEVSALMRENLTEIGGVSYIQAHPVFLYESVLCLILLLFLLASQRRKKFDGEIFMRYLSLYGLIRCFTEWLRTDKLLFPGTRIPVSLAVSVFLFLFFGAEALVRRSMEKKRAAARKRRREAFYAAEEQAEAELDREDERRAREAEQNAQMSAQAPETEVEDDWDGTLPSVRRQQEEAEEDASDTEGKDLEEGASGSEGEELPEGASESEGAVLPDASVSEDTVLPDAAEQADTVQEGSAEESSAEPAPGQSDRNVSDIIE